MPEMANLVYNMYMHMIQTSQKHRQVLTVHHPHMFKKDKYILADIGVKNLAMKSKITIFFSYLPAKAEPGSAAAAAHVQRLGRDDAGRL